MLKIPHTKDLQKVAQRMVWFKSPHDALDDPYTFMAHVMTYGTLKDVIVVKKSLGIDSFKEALDHLPPGIMDETSWHYWSIMMDRYPVSSLPERTFL